MGKVTKKKTWYVQSLKGNRQRRWCLGEQGGLDVLMSDRRSRDEMGSWGRGQSLSRQTCEIHVRALNVLRRRRAAMAGSSGSWLEEGPVSQSTSRDLLSSFLPTGMCLPPFMLSSGNIYWDMLTNMQDPILSKIPAQKWKPSGCC